MKTLLLSALVLFGTANYSQAQTVTYDILFDSLVGLELTSGDICTAPFTVEEAKQISGGNMWGGAWTSTNSGTALFVTVELAFSVNEVTADVLTSLNGAPSGLVNPGALVNCAQGAPISWTIEPSNYNPGGSNSFLVDFSGSNSINQLDNFTLPGDPFLRVTVVYDSTSASLGELNSNGAELIKILDFTGREVEFTPNTPLIYMYSDGSTKRVFKLED